MAKNKKTVKPEDLPYRPCVGILVLNKQNLVWAGRRVLGEKLKGTGGEGSHGWWQMPQGGIDKGEDPAAAALRELHEETGMTSVEVIGESKDWLTYDLPNELIGVAWKGRYRGQQQKWFAVRFLGDEQEITLIPEDDQHDIEFDAWKWVPMPNLVDMIVPFKRDVYRQVIAEFSALAPVPTD